MHPFFDSPTFTWIILPVLIFCARIVDMSFDTLRIIMIGQGRKITAALIGFFEVCLWLLVARQVIVHLPNPLCFFAYAGGFAMGNYVGMWIEERMSVSRQMIRIIMQQAAAPLVEALKSNGFGLTTFAAEGTQGPVSVIYTVVMRKEAKTVAGLIERLAPKAFYTIEDVRYVNEGIFPANQRRWFGRLFD